jgi:hypothetical protein
LFFHVFSHENILETTSQTMTTAVLSTTEAAAGRGEIEKTAGVLGTDRQDLRAREDIHGFQDVFAGMRTIVDFIA